MLDEYRNHLLSTGHALGTVHRRILYIEHLARQFDLLTVTTADLERVLANRRTTHAAETRKAMRSSYRVFYRWATSTGRITVDPAAALLPVHIPITIPRLAPDDVLQLALITTTLPETAMILLARFGCLRLTELSTLHMRHREHDAIRVTGKGDRQRLVYLNSELMHVLLELERELGPDSYYFPGRWGGSMHPQSVGKILTRITGCNPHSLRHAGATAAYNATGNLRAVQDMLGHSSMATTQRYLHLNVEAKRAVAEGTLFLTRPVNPHDPDRIFQHFADAA